MNGSGNIEIVGTKNTDNVQDRTLASGIQLRTSARVLKKQKLDLEASLAAAENKKDEKVEVEVTSSVVVTAPPTTSQPKRPRGICVLWSPEDKNAFFDALNEAGKDVEWIERYMRNKAKKRLGDINSPIVTCKSRLQIKSFFQRTITKISKYIQLPDNVKKSTQELYILINYGELRKRIGLINERNAQKLKELIYCGSTQVRVKGKTWRVKTPVCRALKRLNHLEESVDEVKLPTRVEVLLTPRENKDRVLVESLGYNPRLKTSLPVDTPLVNLINYLQLRWKTSKEDGLVEKNPSRKTALDKTPDPGGGVQFNPSSSALNSGVNNSISSVTNSVTNSPNRAVNPSVNIPGSPSSKPSTPPVICDSLPDLTDCIASPLPISNGSSPPRSQVNKETKEISSPGTKTRLSFNLIDSQMKNRVEKNESKITSSSTTSLKIENKLPLNASSKTEVKTPLNSSTSSKLDLKIESKVEGVLKDGKWPLAIENRGKLWIGAKPNAPLTKTNYKCGQLVTSSCISLIAHQAKIGCPLASLQTLIQVPPPAVKASKSWAKWHKEGEPVDEHVNTDVCDPAILPSSSINPTPTNVSSTSSVLPLFVSQMASTTPGPGVTSTTSSFSPNPFPTFGTTQSQNNAEMDSTPQSNEQQSLPQLPKEETKEEFEARVRKGWCMENTARLRIADLYLIFGSNGKMEAEYWWEGETTSELPSLLKLLSLARLWYSGIPSSPRECWACGHKAPLHNNSNNLSQCSNQLIIDPKVEVKTEVVESSNSTTAAVVVVSSSPTTAGRFRQPLLPAPSSTKRLKSTDETYKSLQLRPKYSNRRGRFRPKNVVVQRMLPLLPKTSTPPSCTVVTLQVVAGDSKGPATGEFINTKSLGVRETSELKPIAPKPSPLDIPSPSAVTVGERREDEMKVDPLNFLTCTLGKDDQVSVKSELPATPSSFSGLLGGGSGAGENDDVSTPPPSPSRILKEGESQWLNSEVADFSLSSFLSHLESPVKTNGLLPLEDTRMSADVDSQLQSLMTESSLDYTAKFADLAAKIAGPGSSNGAPTQPS